MSENDKARLVAEIEMQSIENVFDQKTGQYFAPYNPTNEEIAKELHSQGLTGEGLAIAVLDTGVLSDHPGLKGRITGSADFTGEGKEDLNGHGTTVALLAAGPKKPGPNILNVKVLDKDGTGLEENIVAGMKWAAENGAVALNMSMGIPRDCDGSCLLCSTAAELFERDVMVFAAAGNFGPEVKSCPAQSEYVVSAGALDYEGEQAADYSGLGDVYTPGEVVFVSMDEDGTMHAEEAD